MRHRNTACAGAQFGGPRGRRFRHFRTRQGGSTIPPHISAAGAQELGRGRGL